MTIKDLLNKKKPLVVDNEIIENAFIKPLSVSKFIELQESDELDDIERINVMKNLILSSIVDNENNSVFNDDDLTIDLIEKLVDCILSTNGLNNEGKSNTDELPSI